MTGNDVSISALSLFFFSVDVFSVIEAAGCVGLLLLAYMLRSRDRTIGEADRDVDMVLTVQC